MFTFNGKHVTDPSLGITHYIHTIFPLLPSTRDNILEITGFDGAFDFGYDLQPRTISVQFLIRRDTPEELFRYARAVAAWLNVREVKQFIYDYEPDKYYMVRPQGGAFLDRILANGGFCDVTFVALDPYAYAIEAKTVTTFPAVNSGTASCPALITATMPAAADFLRIEIAEANDYFLLDQELDQGDIVTIDTARRLTLVNDVDARVYVTAASTYPVLPFGEFSFTTEPADIPLIVEYRERWI